jgi:hypothetical protein
MKAWRHAHRDLDELRRRRGRYRGLDCVFRRLHDCRRQRHGQGQLVRGDGLGGLSQTTIGHWKAGDPVNLERRCGSETNSRTHCQRPCRWRGGVKSLVPGGGVYAFTFRRRPQSRNSSRPRALWRSTGMSLTVNEVDGTRFASHHPAYIQGHDVRPVEPGARSISRSTSWRDMWRPWGV